MEKLKIDKTKLITFSNYAKKEGLTRGAIYARAKTGTIEFITIDGVKFVYLK